MRNKHICGQKSVRGMVWFDEWNIGFVRQEIAAVMQEGRIAVEWMKHGYSDRWFADPFLLREEPDAYMVLAEEFLVREQRGVISKLTVDKESLELKQRKVVLEDENIHFSFPYLLRKDEQVFILPEKGKTGQWDVYQYDEEEERCRKVTSWCRRQLADAILIGEDTMLATELPDPDGRELTVYQRKGGMFQKAYTVTFPEHIARNGGSLFEINGTQYRPAQVSNHRYGEGISLQKMEKTGERWTFEETLRLYPQDTHYPKGMHTFQVSQNGNLIVVDGLRYRYSNMLSAACHKLKKTLYLRN